jgi:hypothetical protein
MGLRRESDFVGVNSNEQNDIAWTAPRAANSERRGIGSRSRRRIA